MIYSSLRQLRPWLLGIAVAACTLPAHGQNTGSSPTLGYAGIRAGVGTDIQLGLGVGVGGCYVFSPSESGIAFELGADVYYHSLKEIEDVQRGGVTVHSEEKTTLVVFGVRANGLFNYYPSRRTVYFIAGFGFVVASMEWSEVETAPNWLAPYKDDAEGTSAGNIINLGLGIPLASSLDARVEFPMLYFYSVAGSATAFVPTATISLQYTFR